MNKWIAVKKLLYVPKRVNTRSELLVRIGTPFIVDPTTVSLPVDAETGGCYVEIVGCGVHIEDTVYRADLIQALQLASDVDPILRTLSKTHNLYFVSGEPYFEE